MSASFILGSLVEPERLRFDFTHGKPISPDQIREIEDWINTMALQSVQPVINVSYRGDDGTVLKISFVVI